MALVPVSEAAATNPDPAATHTKPPRVKIVKLDIIPLGMRAPAASVVDGRAPALGTTTLGYLRALVSSAPRRLDGATIVEFEHTHTVIG